MPPNAQHSACPSTLCCIPIKIFFANTLLLHSTLLCYGTLYSSCMSMVFVLWSIQGAFHDMTWISLTTHKSKTVVHTLIKMDEWRDGRDGTLHKMQELIREYLADAAVQQHLTTCAKSLVKQRRIRLQNPDEWQSFAFHTWNYRTDGPSSPTM